MLVAVSAVEPSSQDVLANALMRRERPWPHEPSIGAFVSGQQLDQYELSTTRAGPSLDLSYIEF